MKLEKMKKEELELLSNKDISELILERNNKSMPTAELFKEVIKVLELPESVFSNKIGEFYTSLTTDKRFILLEDGTWDLKTNYTSDKIIKVISDEEDDEELLKTELEEDDEDDHLYEEASVERYDTTEDLKGLVIIEPEDLD